MQQWKNLKSAYRQKELYGISVVGAALLAAVIWQYTDYDLLLGNMGRFYTYSLIAIESILVLLFGINIALLWHKIGIQQQVSKSGTSTLFGSTFGILVSGCPACGVSIASYLGLGGAISALPFFGIELKALGVVLMLYGTNSLTKDLYACKR